MHSICGLPDAGEPRKVIRSRAPFTSDPSQIDLIETLARSATGELQDLTIGWVPDGPHFSDPKSHQSGYQKVTPDGTGYLKDRTPAIGYFHTGLAQLALPRSAVTGTKFERRNGTKSLVVTAGDWPDATGAMVAQPLPYGTRPRLLLLHMCSEAVRTRSRTIAMRDSARAFLRCIGVDTAGKHMAEVRKQLRSLAACHMTISDAGVERITTFKCDPIQGYSEPTKGEWTPELILSENFFADAIAHSMPLDMHAIAQLQNSALALDTYAWLTQRFHNIRDPKGVAISWASLHAQMGQEYASVKKFKHNMKAALGRVRAVYPDAKVEELPGRLLLKPSLAPVPPKALMVVSKLISATAHDGPCGADWLEMSPDLMKWLDRRTKGITADEAEIALTLFKDFMRDKPAPTSDREAKIACSKWTGAHFADPRAAR